MCILVVWVALDFSAVFRRAAPAPAIFSKGDIKCQLLCLSPVHAHPCMHGCRSSLTVRSGLRVGSDWIGSDQIGSGRVRSGRVGSGRVGYAGYLPKLEKCQPAVAIARPNEPSCRHGPMNPIAKTCLNTAAIHVPAHMRTISTRAFQHFDN